MAKKQVLKRLGMQDEFNMWMKDKKTKSFRIGRRVRVKPGADHLYHFTKSGSIGTIVRIDEPLVYVRWEKLTGPQSERSCFPPVFDVKKEFLELI